MRIHVYGAGVLGGNLASNLYRQGKDVTLLARGKWYEEIKRNGLSIHHYFGRKTNVKIPVINQLKSDDIYDVIFVVVRYTQVDSVVEDLNNNGSNMADWLLCHAASVIPIAFACYYANGDIRKLKRDKAYINRIMDATIAAYAVLEDNGHEIMPDSDKDFRNPKFKKKYTPFYQFIFATKLGKLCTSDHAMNAVDEMSALNRDFKAYIGQYGDIPKAWTDLERDTNGYLICRNDRKNDDT